VTYLRRLAIALLALGVLAGAVPSQANAQAWVGPGWYPGWYRGWGPWEQRAAWNHHWDRDRDDHWRGFGHHDHDHDHDHDRRDVDRHHFR